MNHKLNPNLKDFWTTRADVKVLKGGRASGKTWDAAAMAIFLSANYSLRFLCVRQFQANISDSVYTVLCEMIDRMGYSDEFEIQKTTIIHRGTGSEFIFFGFQRNTASIKGTEGVDICWIEEAESLTKEQWEIIEPTIRKEGSECWILYNPRLSTDFVERNFRHDPERKTIVRVINYIENPYLSTKMLRTIERAKERDYDDYEHIYLGVPRSDDDAVVIKRSWIMAAVDAHLDLHCKSWTGAKTVGYDVADSGSDYNAAIFIDGSICMAVDEWKAAEDELFKSSRRVKSFAVEHGASHIGYDSIGVGAGVGGNLNELGFRSHFKFNAGGKVANPKKKYKETKVPNEEFFANLKAQSWWILADRFMNTYNAIHKGFDFDPDKMISINGNIPRRMLDKLIDELSTPRRDFDNGGRVKVESKKDLAKREVPSPNLADAFVIAYSKGMLARTSVGEMMGRGK